jgi:hypothetical protein
MATSTILPDVAISFPEDFDTCPACCELRFFVGAQAICGCNAGPSGPAVAAARPHAPQSPVDEAETLLVAA